MTGANRQGLVGTQVGPYQVQELLGTGGFAAVYRAHDPRLRSDVALKVLADIHALNPDVRERFVSEGHLLRRIDNPLGLQVYDIGETDQGNPFLVLELADRGNFESRVHELRASGWSPGADDVGALVAGLADALEAFHDHDVVHRDVKPSNLLITSTRRTTQRGDCTVLVDDERLLLADLGLAKDLAAASGLTVSGGSAGFAAQEQLLPGSIVDERADVFAATATVAWLLSARSPTDGSSWETHCDQRFAPLLPHLRAGLSTDPNERPATIRLWADALQRALAAVPQATSDPAAVAPTVITPAPTNLLAAASPSAPAEARREAEPAAGPAPHLTADHERSGLTDAPKRPLPSKALFAGFAGLLLVVATTFWATRGPDVATLDDGRARVEATATNATIAIVGPATTRVGETARYEAQVAGADRWTLIGPDGVTHHDAQAIDVTATSTGAATVRLVATTSAGQVLEAELPLQVLES